MLKRVYDRLFPGAETLISSSDAEIMPVTVNGAEYMLPVYGFEITSCDELADNILFYGEDKKKHKIGRELLYRIGVNDVPHLARVILPNDADRHNPAHDFSFNRSTAYTTTIDGYAKHGTDDIVAATGRAFIHTGAAYSGADGVSVSSLLDVPATVWSTRHQTIHGQSEARYVMQRYLSALHDLPEEFAITGDSMSAINQPAMYGYDYVYSEGADQPITAEYSRIIGFHAKGRCVLERVEYKDLPKVGLWLMQTMLGGVASAACLARDGELGTLEGSITSSPKFNASAFSGTLRALASGEAGIQLGLIPDDAGGMEVQYGADALSDTGIVRQFYENYPNVRHKIVPKGTHGAIIHPLADDGRTAWAKRLSEDYDRVAGQKSNLEWKYINDVPEVDPSIPIAA